MPSVRVTLAVLSATILLLASLAVLFAVATIWLRVANTRKARRWAVLEERWEARLLDVLAGGADADTVLRLVGPGEALLFVDFLLRFLRRLTGSEREVVRRLARPHLAAVAAQLRLRNSERRARAVQSLSLLGPGEHGAAVVRALDDPSDLVAMVAARALARDKDPAHAEAILRRLRRFAAWSPRYLASMLAGMGRDAAPSLCDFLADPAQPAALRAVAAEALRMLHDLHAADVAAAVAGTTENRDLLAASLRLLAALGRPEHVPRVLARIADGDPVVRAMAVRALGALGAAPELAPLRHALDDPSPWVAIEAAEGLRAAGGLSMLAAVADSPHPRAELARQVLRSAA